MKRIFKISHLVLGVSSFFFSSYSYSATCVTSATAPATLSQTCLNQAIAYEPNFALFSNSAEKARWILLPENTMINTANPDYWEFPQGTILWKEFALNGKKIETRQLEKIDNKTGPASWRASVYLWREDQSDADLSPDGKTGQSGTAYEWELHKDHYQVPNPTACISCHQGAKDMVLGFSYLQLSGNPKIGVRLADLINQSKLSHPPATEDIIAGSVKDQKALGYLQANCAHCHNPLGMAGYFLDVHHTSGATSLSEENGYKQLVDSGLMTPGNAKQSYFFQRLSNGEMPPNWAAQKFVIDPAGVSTIEDWINSL